MSSLSREDRSKISQYLFNRRESLYIPDVQVDEKDRVHPNVVFGMIANLDEYGYTLSAKAIDQLLTLDQDTVEEIYEDTVRNAQASRTIEHPDPLFKNFPESCLQMDPEELSETRFATYFTQFIDIFLGTDITKQIDWDGPMRERARSKDHPLRIMQPASEQDLKDIAKNLLSGRMSISEADKELIEFAIRKFGDREIVPEKVPYKENEAWIIKKAAKGELSYKAEIKTVDDFIRVASELSGGLDYSRVHDLDRSLLDRRYKDTVREEILRSTAAFEKQGMKRYEAEAAAWKEFESRHPGLARNDRTTYLKKNPRIAPLPTAERRLLLSGLSNTAINGTKAEKERLEESLLDPKNRRIFQNITGFGIRGDGLWHTDTVRNRAKFPGLKEVHDKTIGEYSHLSKAEQALAKGRGAEAMREYMAASPGYAVRNLVSVMCKAKEEEKDDIMKVFRKAAERTKPAVLFQLKAAVRSHDSISVAYPGGNTAKPFLMARKNHMKEADVEKVIEVIDKAAAKSMSVMRSEGKAYIDPALKECPIPFSGKEITGEVRACEKGTFLPPEADKDTMRFFCSKKCQRGGFYDLSAHILDDKFNLLEHCSWTNLQLKVNGHDIGVHSGDNANSREGCTEYIDISKSALKEAIQDGKENDQKIGAARYVAVSVFAWNRIPFNEMDYVKFGMMERDAPGSDSVTQEDMKRLKLAGCNDQDLKGYNGKSLCYYQIPDEYLDAVKDYRPETAFDPATVTRMFDMKGDTLAKVAMMYDIENDKYIVADIDCMCMNDATLFKPVNMAHSQVDRERIVGHEHKLMMVEDFVGQTAQACYATTHVITQKPTLYDLFTAWAAGNEAVELVDSPEKADTVFTVDRPREDTEQRYITPFDKDVIAAEFLTPLEKETDELIREPQPRNLEEMEKKVAEISERYEKASAALEPSDVDDPAQALEKLEKLQAVKHEAKTELKEILADWQKESGMGRGEFMEYIREEGFLGADLIKSVDKYINDIRETDITH